MRTRVLLAFLFLQLPQNDTIPQADGRHTSLNHQVLRNLSFSRRHSGFYNDNKDRLQSEIIANDWGYQNQWFKHGSIVQWADFQSCNYFDNYKE